MGKCNITYIMSAQIKWLTIFLFSIVALFLNFAIIDHLIMPDPCYYHTNQMNLVLSFFYTAAAVSGGHPEINLFNIVFTIIFGGLIGKFFCNFWLIKIK